MIHQSAVRSAADSFPAVIPIARQEPPIWLVDRVSDLAPKKRGPSAVEQQISAAMGTVERQNTETNAKLDDIVEQLKGMTAWMKAMDSTTKSLSESAVLLQLHAEDASTRLEALESPPTRPQGPASATTTPPSVVVHAHGGERPSGHSGHHQQRGPVLGDPRSPNPPPGVLL